jgi:aryl-alcohol dehydrogenase-like predicted oxidoreductase
MAEALETIIIPGTKLNPTRIALGTWAIGGWMWGGTNEAESIRTIRSAVDRGISLIDTAPVYWVKPRLVRGARGDGSGPREEERFRW